ncbi:MULTISPECIES: DUF6624 domain-containing protein [unclassified Pseudoalteromonas]|uniref:DUF6624 domain-containing protein n=1 Tax=unclassified Pseudoalteromonas TaxID=194690 RepID=UPI0018CDA8A4|nr:MULTISPECIES: DUF6624 domain-containing protein [unclassified Pseudoalteromonas]MBH0010941.1 hypothetical protein [Pseudoalteromonas sp. NZS100_1]MBH0048462.1 hypothetical protein [Pseudoalteromonas sp. SWYJZ19]
MRYLFLLLLIPFYSFAEINLPLQKELIEMEIEDQHIRNKIGKAGWQNPPKTLLEQMMKIDESNTGKLKAIIKKHHWVTKDLVGVKGVGAAFLVIQHSPDVAFKVKMLPYLKQSYLNGEGVSGQQVALLTDRVLIAQGKKQIYGTQADVSEGKVVFSPIEDETNVDKLREEMKMPSLDFYLKIMEKMYGIKEHPEIDLN